MLLVEVVMEPLGVALAQLVCLQGGSPHIPSYLQNSGSGSPWQMKRKSEEPGVPGLRLLLGGATQ